MFLIKSYVNKAWGAVVSSEVRMSILQPYKLYHTLWEQ